MIEYRQRQCETMGVKFFYVSSGDKTFRLLQGVASGKKGCGMAIFAQAKKNQIKARQIVIG